MRHFVPALVAAAVMVASCSEGFRYTVSGSGPFFSRYEGDYVYLVTNHEWRVIDSAMVGNSSFHIEGECDSAEIVYAYLGKDMSSATNIGNPFILEEGDVRAVEKSEGWYGFTGTPSNDRLADIFAEFRSIADDRAKLDFLAGEISRHHNILGVSLLCDYYILSGGSSITAARLMEGFPEELRQTPSMLFLEQLVSRAKTDVDGKYMDIEGESVDGAVIDLASVVDRDGAMYVLLDFWATWCGACRESLPDLKSAYSEYKGKGFDVYAVSFDGDREQWSDFVHENGLGWTNVIIDIPASGFRDVPEVAAYGVNGLPWNYLIDCSTGIIVGKNLYGEALFSRLSGLLGN